MTIKQTLETHKVLYNSQSSVICFSKNQEEYVSGTTQNQHRRAPTRMHTSATAQQSPLITMIQMPAKT